MQDSMQLKVRIQWNQNITEMKKTLTNEAISIPWSALAEPEKWIGIPSGRGKLALATQTL